MHLYSNSSVDSRNDVSGPLDIAPGSAKAPDV